MNIVVIKKGEKWREFGDIEKVELRGFFDWLDVKGVVKLGMSDEDCVFGLYRGGFVFFFIKSGNIVGGKSLLFKKWRER